MDKGKSSFHIEYEDVDGGEGANVCVLGGF